MSLKSHFIPALRVSRSARFFCALLPLGFNCGDDTGLWASVCLLLKGRDRTCEHCVAVCTSIPAYRGFPQFLHKQVGHGCFFPRPSQFTAVLLFPIFDLCRWYRVTCIWVSYFTSRTPACYDDHLLSWSYLLLIHVMFPFHSTLYNLCCRNDVVV
jgi:hypothetical protein